MYAHELFEQNKPRVVVTYPGRFQPFHQGHAGVFAQLQKKFGAGNVFIATSNDQSSAKSPFNFSDKVQLMNAAGVPSDKIYQTTAMYALPEGFDPASTVFVTAVGAPDADRLNPDSFLKRDKKDKDGNIIKPAGSPGYYKTWGGDKTPVTADQHGYVIVIPEIHKTIKIGGKDYDVSHGTECRNLWNIVRKNPKLRSEFLSQLYGRPDQHLGVIFDKIPEAANEDIAPTDSNDSASPISGARVFYEEYAAIGEGFDKPYSLQWETTEYGDVDALAKLEDGTNLSINFNLEYGDEGEEFTHVEFHRNNSQQVTGEGDAQRIFATVLAAIQQYIKKHNPQRLEFSASKEVEQDQNSESRAKLYDRLVQRYAKAWGYRAFRADTGSIVRYELSKIKKDVAEEASGVIATKKQAKDPRYSMSLTKDVRPGQIEKNLRAFKLAELREPDVQGSMPYQWKRMAPVKVPYSQKEMDAINSNTEYWKKNPVNKPANWDPKYPYSGFYDQLSDTWPVAPKSKEAKALSKSTPNPARPPAPPPAGTTAAPNDEYAAAMRQKVQQRSQFTTPPADLKNMPQIDRNRPDPLNKSQLPFKTTSVDTDADITAEDSVTKNKKVAKTSDFEIRNFEKLDSILVDLCSMVVEGQKKNSNLYGMVAACVLDPENRYVARLNYLNDATDKRVHAERAAIEAYESKYGEIPEGSIIVTTLSPCCHDMEERDGPSCTELINNTNVHKVYCGYKDPSQHTAFKTWHVMQTRNENISALCKQFADTFLKDPEALKEDSVTKQDMMKMVKEFLPVAMKELGIKKLPEIILQPHVDAGNDGQATFGRFVNEEEKIYLGIADRHPVDILRTLAHELVHFKQYEDGKMYDGAGETGSPIENEAHWVAGIIMRHFNKKYPKAIKSKPLELNEDKEEKCPPATQDITLNLKNRQKAIDEYGYGPLNPDLPNTKFWMKKVDEWNLDSADEAKQSLCGNCAAFDIRQNTLDCIAQGIDSDSPQDAEAVIDAGDLGYCKFLKFKCASRRTCDAWVTGGPLTDQVSENLRDWFKEKWVRFGPDGKIRGDCARGEDSEGKPKCLPQAKAHALGKKGRASAAARKRREDPNPERSGKAINVDTKKKTNEEICPECGGPMFSELLINEKKDACYYKVKSRYKVWPSAYASGALVKCRKKGASNWGNKSESISEGADKKEAVRRIQKLLNKKFGANLDVDGVLGPLTLKSINKFIPKAKAGLADEPNKTTAVQGKKIKDSAEEQLYEKWTEKYKHSIDCSHPKGFSQKAHCAGRKKNEDRHPNDTPYGPESKPTMPQGTVRVDVSDVYDWYKLGQNISNLDRANPAMFGKGPPSTIMAFGSEDEEHKYIDALEKLGLTTTDIDPIDPKQPKNMPRQKVDPTFNVSENFADGRNPQDKGDSKRYNVPTKGSISSLRKIAKQGGRRGQLAHWMANMKAGKKK